MSVLELLRRRPKLRGHTDASPSLFDNVYPTHNEPPDSAQRKQALDITRSWLVEAPAGSGKTGLLIQRFLRLLGVVSNPEAVLALTFTNKATAEMRDRVLEALDSAAVAASTSSNSFEEQTLQAARAALRQDALHGWKLRENPHRLNIRTIDSFCGEIARAVPVLAGGIGEAKPLTDASALYRQAARSVFLRLGGPDAILSDALRTILLLRDGNLEDCEQLLANMLATREQWGELVPLSDVELNEQTLDHTVLPRLNETLRSILCANLTQLQRRFPTHLLSELAELANLVAVEPGYREEPNPLLGCSSLRMAPGSEAIDLEHWRMLAHLLLTGEGKWRNSFKSNHISLSIPKPRQDQLKGIIAALQTDERLRDLLCSLQDLPPGTNRVTHALGMHLQHLLVDEMEDTSSSQYELLEELTRGWVSPEQTVFLVGDPKQSIYLFRQARVERFIQNMKSKSIGDVSLGVLRLSANFRSGATLVSSFNEMFEPIFSDPLDGISYTHADAILP